MRAARRLWRHGATDTLEDSMIRWLMIALLTLSFGFAACGSSKKTQTETETHETAPAETPRMADSEAVVGTWREGTTSITFKDNMTYRWDQTRPCGSPPCPTTTTTGRYEFRGGNLYIIPEGGTAEVLNMSFSGDQNALKLTSNKRNQSWSLTRGN